MLPSPPEPPTAEPAPPPEPPKIRDKPKKAPAPPKRAVMTPEMNEKLSALLLALLERDARIQDLDQKLDEAVQETVRSKAKLAGQESRAEAASNLAEAEVALKTLKASVKGLEKRPEHGSLIRLMKTSAEELKKENYGGSLYLTNRIKERLRELQERIESEQQDKASAAAGRSAASSEFDAKLARWQVLLSVKEAEIQTLRRKLDDAIQEAVRTKSKLRSQESRAEAASNLAEAETALKTLQPSVSGLDAQAGVTRAQALMKMGAEELQKANYSGSLYLTNQVKAILKQIEAGAKERERMTLMEGEMPFAAPLPVKLAASGKVRERPSADSPVAWSVERNASQVVVSYKGQWLRVKGEGDRRGWMFYDLIAYP